MSYKKFEKLDKNKKNLIIMSAIKEFNAHGYTSASTNIITKNAGISKGALFSYFGNKEKLFIYLFDYVISNFMELMMPYLESLKEKDIFDRIKLATKWKLDMFIEKPDEFLFMTNAMLNVPDNIHMVIIKKVREIQDKGMKILFSPDAFNAFKEGIDPQQALFVILSTMEGLSNKYMKEYKEDYKKLIEDRMILLKEFNNYLEFLKESFGKKE